MAEREREKLDHLESDLATYQREVQKPFEHEARLRALDLYKSDPQGVTVPDE
jgi:hypothetical protein